MRTGLILALLLALSTPAWAAPVHMTTIADTVSIPCDDIGHSVWLSVGVWWALGGLIVVDSDAAWVSVWSGTIHGGEWNSVVEGHYHHAAGGSTRREFRSPLPAGTSLYIPGTIAIGGACSGGGHAALYATIYFTTEQPN